MVNSYNLPLSLILADPSDVMLLGLRVCLHGQMRFDLIGSVRTAADLFNTLQDADPHLIVLNESLSLDPQTDILTLVNRLKTDTPHARLLVIGALAEGLFVRDLVRAGVMGCLYDGDDLLDCLLPALKSVAADRPYLSPTASAAYLTVLQSPRRDWQMDSEARTVLRLLARGLHTGAIAMQMNIPIRRVYGLRERLRRLFGVMTNEHLISRAIAEGFAARDE